MIKQRTLGRTGLKVSELCLGTMNFGWKTDEQKSFAILDAYFEAGGNFIQATGIRARVCAGLIAPPENHISRPARFRMERFASANA